MKSLFGAFPILLPKECDYNKWAVIACDQYTTDRNYWDDLYRHVGSAPSTLHLIYPEIYLKDADFTDRINKINACMKEYAKNGFFKEISGMVLVERTMTNGKKRIGLVMSVDLEQYEYKKANVPIRATEATIVERLPVRMQIKENATIELPHILLLIDDDKKEIIESLYDRKNDYRMLYDFELNKDGGHVKGYHIVDPADTEKKLLSLLNENVQLQKYGVNAGMLFAVGDGNHSMASAKEHWNKIKTNLSEKEKENHPARYILVEVVNLYQESMDFEPIHRIIMNCNTDDFICELSKKLSGKGEIELYTCKGRTILPCPADAALTIKTIQDFLIEYKNSKNAIIDYEHSEKQVLALSQNKDTVGILMPTFDKSKLFNYVVHYGNLPQKAFSIGTEDNKKYYIEAKRIIL